jgi:hypothetical protein
MNVTASSMSSLAGSVISMSKAMFGLKFRKHVLGGLRPALPDGLLSLPNSGNETSVSALTLVLV